MLRNSIATPPFCKEHQVPEDMVMADCQHSARVVVWVKSQMLGGGARPSQDAAHTRRTSTASSRRRSSSNALNSAAPPRRARTARRRIKGVVESMSTSSGMGACPSRGVQASTTSCCRVSRSASITSTSKMRSCPRDMDCQKCMGSNTCCVRLSSLPPIKQDSLVTHRRLGCVLGRALVPLPPAAFAHHLGKRLCP